MTTRTIVGKGPAVGWASEPVQPSVMENGTVVGPIPDMPSHLIAGLSLLLRALDYATDAGRDSWDFAIELSELRESGMTTSDFRWLVSKGFVEHGQETSLYGAPQRCFRRGEGLTFLPSSALVLTSLGAAKVRKLRAAAVDSELLHSAVHATATLHLLVAEPDGPRPANHFVPRLLDDEEATASDPRRLPPSRLRLLSSAFPLPPGLKPAWEARHRELRVGAWLVKKFRVPATNQERILSAFEEEGWPDYIDDPLPMKSEIVPKRRLHNVINRLNGSQLAPILRFHGNGNGDAIGWHLLPADCCS